MDGFKENFLSEKFNDIFEHYIADSGYRMRTRNEYYGRICMLTRWCGKDFLSITREDAMHYFHYLHNQNVANDISLRTIYSRMNTYMNLASFIVSNSLVEGYVNPFVDIKITTPANNSLPIRNIPSSSVLDLLLEKAPSEMYYLVFTLALRVGLSLAEIVALTMNHVVESNGVIFLHCNVRAVIPERLVPLPQDVGTLMKNYISGIAHMDERGHLFYNKRGNPLTADNIERCIRGIVKSCDFDVNYSMRDLRTRSILDMVSASIQSENSVDAVADYVGLRDRRLRTYIKANSNIISTIPANLVNISVKPYKKEEDV